MTKLDEQAELPSVDAAARRRLAAALAKAGAIEQELGDGGLVRFEAVP